MSRRSPPTPAAEEPTFSRRELTFEAADGMPLAGDLFEPAAVAPRAAVVVASALGVRRRLYAAFAEYLAEHDFAVLTFDYRGVGGSRPRRLRGFPGRMRDWGEHDLEAAVGWLGDRHPGLPLAVLGHSAGGQVFGLVASYRRVAAVLGVAAQNGHWRYWSGWHRLWVLTFWYLLAPLGIRLCGFLPMKLLTGGENVPAEVGRDWVRWGRHPEYVVAYARAAGLDEGYRRWSGRLAAWGFADDHAFAPPRAVARLPDFYPAAASEVRILEAAELGVRKIGHFACFGRRFRPTLWVEMRRWLEEVLGLPAQAAGMR